MERDAKARHRVFRYIVALAALGLTLAIRIMLRPILGEQGEFLVFVVPIVLASLLGGVRLGLFTMLFGAVLAFLFLIYPTHPGAVVDPDNAMELLLFLTVGSLITYLTAQTQAARQEAQDAVESLEKSVAELQTLMDLAPIPIFVGHDPECAHITGNRAAAALLESSAGDNLTATGPEPGPPVRYRWFRDGKEVPPTELPMQYAAAHGVEVREAGLDIQFNDGKIKHIIGQVAPIHDTDGPGIRGVLGVFVDITEHMRIQKALRESEERFRIALQNSPLTVYHCDRHLRYTWVHNTHPAFRAENLIGKRAEELEPPLVSEELTAFKRQVLETGVGTHREIAGEISGVPFVYDITAEPLRDVSGEIVGLTVAALDVTAYKRAEAALVAADRAKDEFLAMLAHELRNPLGAIGNAAELLHIRLEGDSRVERPLKTLRRQVKHMARLVDDLLDVSRITRGHLELRKVTVDLVDVTRRASEAIVPQMESLRHTYTVSLPEAPLLVNGDPTRLEQVIGNLLNNAAKYTDCGGQIGLELERQDGWAVVRVRDNGSGISPEMRPRIFDLFAQEDRSLARSRGGLGIGLTVVKQLVEMHGGTVDVRSDGPGKGSEFTVRLPLWVG